MDRYGIRPLTDFKQEGCQVLADLGQVRTDNLELFVRIVLEGNDDSLLVGRGEAVVVGRHSSLGNPSNACDESRGDYWQEQGLDFPPPALRLDSLA